MNGESIYTALESINDGAIEEALKPALISRTITASQCATMAEASHKVSSSTPSVF